MPYQEISGDILSISFGKTFFAWHFNTTICSVIISYALSEPFVFSVSALSSNIYCKINFMTQNGSDLCNFYSKLKFGIFFYKKLFVSFFFADFKLLMFHNSISLISNKWNLLKTFTETTYPIAF